MHRKLIVVAVVMAFCAGAFAQAPRKTPVPVKAKAAKTKAPQTIDLNLGDFPSSGTSTSEPQPSRQPQPSSARNDLGPGAVPSQRQAIMLPPGMATATPRPEGATPTPAVQPDSQRAAEPTHIGRQTLPGGGSFRELPDGGREYDDGTVTDASGNAKMLEGRPLKKPVNLQQIRTYMKSNSEADVDSAVQAVGSEQ